jgi:general secretion pathway protein M
MISQLNQRERIFVVAGGGLLVLVLLYIAVVLPYRNALSRLDTEITVRSRQLQEVQSLKTRYLSLQQEMTQVERLLDNRREFSPLTFIENLVGKTAGRENLVSMRPQAPVTRNNFTIESVELKLEKLTLRQVLELLWGVEQATTPMRVRSLQLKQRFDDRSLLDATMTVTALGRVQ